jgi:rhombotail lipoprotein
MKRRFPTRSLSVFFIALCITFSLSGCATTREKHNAASVVDFLFPDTKEPVVTPGIPVLKLPLRVGIAFVPSSGRAYSQVSGLTEKRKTDLMQQVAGHFKKYPFVKEIEVIPSAYLRTKGSFANLDQIRTIYGVDVIALISYDQVQFTDQDFLSLTYWTIVGAYIVPGEKNSTHTLLDTVVYDVASRKMLFRAPGTHHVKGRTTLANLTEQLRLDSETGFSEAAKDMTANLDIQLAVLKDKIKERPEEYKVVRTPEYVGRTGGGSIDEIMLALLIALGGGLWWIRRRA